MKTAIVKTSFWDDEEYTGAHIDTKLVYVHLLTNPSRGLSPYMKINKTVMSARTGLNGQNVQLGLDQLVKMGWILEYKSYVMLLTDHVEAKKGRFTEQALTREMHDIPQEIINYFYKNSSGTVPVHKDKDNNKYNNKDKNIIKPVDEAAIRLANDLCENVTLNFNFVKCDDKKINAWAKDIEKIHRIDGYEWDVIEAVLKWSQSDSFWYQNIRSGSKLREKFEELLVRAKVEHDNQQDRVVVV